MSRSSYDEDCEPWDLIRWRGAVASAVRGRRGQAFLKEMLAAFDALPTKRLIENELEEDGDVCALGAVGKARGLNLQSIDPDDLSTVAGKFEIAEALAAEIMFENDEGAGSRSSREAPEKRYDRMRRWIAALIHPEPK